MFIYGNLVGKYTSRIDPIIGIWSNNYDQNPNIFTNKKTSQSFHEMLSDAHLPRKSQRTPWKPPRAIPRSPTMQGIPL